MKKHRAPLTTEEKTEIIDLFKTGNYTFNALARKFNIHQKSIQTFLKNKGFKALPRLVTNEMIIEMIDLYKSGEHNIVTIAKKYGVCNQTVFYHLRKNGFFPNNHRKPLTKDEESQILELYKTGEYTFADLARKFDKCEQAIDRLTKKHGLKAIPRKLLNEEQIQELIELYKTNKYSYEDLGKIYNMKGSHIGEYLRNRGFKGRDTSLYRWKYHTNQHFCDNIDSESKAYFMGWMYSDGCNSSRTKTISLTLQERDKEILEKLRDLISPDRPIAFIDSSLRKNTGNYNRQNYYRFSFSNVHLSKQLTKLGCPSNKTFKIVFPNWLDESLYSHFIRGMIDGDGYITKNLSQPIVTLTTTLSFCNTFKDYLKDNLNINATIKPIYKKDSVIKVLGIKGGIQVRSFLDWLYKDATIFLHRKYERYMAIKNKYEQWIKSREVSLISI